MYTTHTPHQHALHYTSVKTSTLYCSTGQLWPAVSASNNHCCGNIDSLRAE